MPQVHWNENYILDIYNEGAYYYFDFYGVINLGSGEFKLTGSQNIDFTLETFRESLLKDPECYRDDCSFTIFYRIDPSDTRFYCSELLVDEDTFDIVKEALVFCEEYWNNNYKKRLKE